jgi:hypothetical protein
VTPSVVTRSGRWWNRDDSPDSLEEASATIDDILSGTTFSVAAMWTDRLRRRLEDRGHTWEEPTQDQASSMRYDDTVVVRTSADEATLRAEMCHCVTAYGDDTCSAIGIYRA